MAKLKEISLNSCNGNLEGLGITLYVYDWVQAFLFIHFPPIILVQLIAQQQTKQSGAGVLCLIHFP